MARYVFLSIALSLLIPFAHPEARVPPLLNYQGHLKTAADTLLSDTVRIAFSIYDAETDGALLWSETHAVEVAEGQFHVLLGSLTPFPERVFFEGSRYLSLRIDGADEILPRQRIVSVAYALRAAQADDVSGRDISPRSIALARGNAVLDSAGGLSVSRIAADSLALSAVGTVIDAGGNWVGGNVTSPRIATDSLVVGGKGVIGHTGEWTGPPIPVAISGMVLDTLIVRNVPDSVRFYLDSRWQSIRNTTDDQEVFTTFVTLKRSTLLDIQFNGVISTRGGFETRIIVKPENPAGPIMYEVGNISGMPPAEGSESVTSPVVNTAVVSLSPGLYRIFVETRASGPRLGTLRTGILVIRAFAR